jgi:hypothetical protein
MADGCLPERGVTLMYWVEAHRSFTEAEAHLVALARQVAAQESTPAALDLQRARVAVLRDRAEKLYDEAMEDLRSS